MDVQPPKDNGANGIDFKETPGQNSDFSGDFNWIQVYAPHQFYWNAKGTLLDTLSGAGLDADSKHGKVFFGYIPGDPSLSTNDSPNTQPAVVTNGVAAKIVVNDTATIWLMYQPKVPGSIWVPISSINWNWGGTDTFVGGSWSLTNGSWAHNPTGSATHTFPDWDGYRNLTVTPAP